MRPTHIKQREQGFTLLEVLIVLAILGVLYASFFVQSGLVGRDNTLKEAANDLVGTLKLAQDEAILAGQELGLRVREHGYSFQRYNGETGEWDDIAGDKYLSEKNLGDDVALELEVDAQLVVLDDQLENQLRADENAKNPEPQIWVLPDGGIEPQFTLRIHRDPREPAYEVKLTELGELSKQALEKLF